MTEPRYTPAEIARALDRVDRQSPEDTASLAWMSEAALRWVRHYPQIEPAQQAFDTARVNQYPRRRTAETWAAVVRTAAALAAALRDVPPDEEEEAAP